MKALLLAIALATVHGYDQPRHYDLNGLVGDFDQFGMPQWNTLSTGRDMGAMFWTTDWPLRCSLYLWPEGATAGIEIPVPRASCRSIDRLLHPQAEAK